MHELYWLCWNILRSESVFQSDVDIQRVAEIETRDRKMSRKPNCYGQATMDSLGGLTWK